MCNFNDKEIETLTKNGNDVSHYAFILLQNAYKTLMAAYNSKLYPEPDKRDAVKMKEFFNIKYKQRRFAQKDDSDDGSDGSESEAEKKKKKKKDEKKKKKQKKESSEEEQSESEDSDGASKSKKKGTGKLMAPPSSGKAAGMKNPRSVEKYTGSQNNP